MARWYQTTIRTGIDALVTNADRSTVSAHGRTVPPARRTTVTRCPETRRSGSRPAALRQRTRRPGRPPAVDDEHGSVRRPVRGRDRARTPHAAASWNPVDRGERCTTVLRPVHVGLRRQGAGRRSARGYARSSREAMAALGAAGLQHGAAGPGAHAGAKAVLLGTATVVGLVGALHAALLERPGWASCDEKCGIPVEPVGPAVPAIPAGFPEPQHRRRGPPQGTSAKTTGGRRSAATEAAVASRSRSGVTVINTLYSGVC